MSMYTTHYAFTTSITQRFPWGVYRGGRAMCSDGKVRRIARISATADTAFSIPAAVVVRRRKVSGYITIETVSGLSTPIDGDPLVVKFCAHNYAKNADALPRGLWRVDASGSWTFELKETG